jgi:quercetin dioxygenase-like cupin family protein
VAGPTLTAMDQSDTTQGPQAPGRASAAPSGLPSALPVDLRDWVRFSTEAAVRVRVQRTDTLAVDLWCIEPQQATEVLRAAGDVTYTVLAGRSWFVTEDGDIGLDPLGSMLVGRGVAHGIDNRAPDPLIVLAVSSPPDAAPLDAAVSDAGGAVRPSDPERRGVLTRLSTLLGR